MGTCTFRKHKTERLCANDLKHLASVLERNIVGDAVFDEEQDATDLQLIMQAWVAIDTGKSVYNAAPINGLNDTNKPTHRISFRVSDLNGLEIDVTKHILEIGGKNYRIVDIDNVNMDNEILDCYCIIRGAEGYEAQS